MILGADEAVVVDALFLIFRLIVESNVFRGDSLERDAIGRTCDRAERKRVRSIRAVQNEVCILDGDVLNRGVRFCLVLLCDADERTDILIAGDFDVVEGEILE